jgi:hypothetical protein
MNKPCNDSDDDRTRNDHEQRTFPAEWPNSYEQPEQDPRDRDPDSAHEVQINGTRGSVCPYMRAVSFVYRVDAHCPLPMPAG